MKIDKSVFSAAELIAYEALIAKAKVDPEAAQEEMEEQMPPEASEPTEKEMPEEPVEEEEEEVEPPVIPAKKSMAPELAEAMARLEKLEKSYEMQEYLDIAKGYEIIGENAEQLAQTLYNLEKSNPQTYDAYIGILDRHKALVEKSGLYSEIGKSASAYAGASTVEGKIQAKAAEILKSAPELTHDEAVAKAWEENPELLDEYDAEYAG